MSQDKTACSWQLLCRLFIVRSHYQNSPATFTTSGLEVCFVRLSSKPMETHNYAYITVVTPLTLRVVPCSLRTHRHKRHEALETRLSVCLPNVMTAWEHDLRRSLQSRTPDSRSTFVANRESFEDRATCTGRRRV